MKPWLPLAVTAGAALAGQRGQRAVQPPSPFAVTYGQWIRETKRALGLETLHAYVNDAGDLELSLLQVPTRTRNAGTGTRFMEAFTAFADAHGRRILLSPTGPESGMGTTSKARLKRFYKRFGFVENKGRNKDYSTRETMYRMPR